MFPSETTWPLETKLWWNGPWVIPFPFLFKVFVDKSHAARLNTAGFG
jgi:hypothetical protein